MCSECGEDHEPICDYCGDSCFGGCEDPDVCRSCWFDNSVLWEHGFDDFDGELLDGCMEEDCACNCHEDMWEDIGYRLEAGVLKSVEEHGFPYEREGVFPFLKLPGEIREKIYGFSFLQNGKQRKSASHRGSIHTALLGTCRQIFNEARHLPLALNKLCFGSPLFALDFLGFLLAPTQRHLVTGMHIEFHMREFSNSSWQLLMRELIKLPINHLCLTIKGGIPKEQVSGHTCLTNRFKVLKGLKTFNLILTSAYIKKQDKKDIQEEMREKLIKDYARPKELKKSKTKRAASAEVVAGSRKATKKSKKANTSIKHQTKIVAAPKSGRLSLKSQRPELDAAIAAKDRAKQALLDQYNQLKQYATSLDSDVAPVKIRLEQAREAAEAIDETKFEKLAHGIFLTLEERYNSIAAAREEVPAFRTPFPSPEPPSSPEWSSSSDSREQLSM
ncbi:MAG: hypothetical protein ALECFALPRED_010297 [Alectoria fallacina]|uniref:Uncharacterized protein n=1 Tax=Alectoria fallacina TaxID=1903189 RepID=A0A8H3F7G4_9LECA|nr:MAG: hypothetical protein ALECFALPRED_010297 [Alectoria fallacina]